MKFLASILAVAAMVSSAQACQCLKYDGGKYAERPTKTCCWRSGASMSGTVCSRRTMNDMINLRAFQDCCRTMNTKSDCYY